MQRGSSLRKRLSQLLVLLFLCGPSFADYTTSRVSTSGVVLFRDGYINPSQRAVLAADYTNATTTLTALGLLGSVAPSRRMAFTAAFFLSDSTAVDGVKLDWNAGTGAFASNMDSSCVLTTSVGAVTVQTNAIATSLTTVVNAAALTDTNTHLLYCQGGLTVTSAPGTFGPRFAQNSHTTGTLTVLAGSWLMVEEILP